MYLITTGKLSTVSDSTSWFLSLSFCIFSRYLLAAFLWVMPMRRSEFEWSATWAGAQRKDWTCGIVGWPTTSSHSESFICRTPLSWLKRKKQQQENHSTWYHHEFRYVLTVCSWLNYVYKLYLHINTRILDSCCKKGAWNIISSKMFTVST